MGMLSFDRSKMQKPLGPVPLVPVQESKLLELELLALELEQELELRQEQIRQRLVLPH